MLPFNLKPPGRESANVISGMLLHFVAKALGIIYHREVFSQGYIGDALITKQETSSCCIPNALETQ